MYRLGFLGALSVFCWLAAGSAAAHDCDHHGHHYYYYYDDCWGNGPNYRQDNGRQYTNGPTPAAVMDQRTFEGRIAEVVYLPGATPETAMVEIRLQAGSQTTLVRLAPSGFLRQSGMLLREGETITVRGYSVAGLEGDLIVATEIRHGDKTLNLRDSRGRSAW